MSEKKKVANGYLEEIREAYSSFKEAVAGDHPKLFGGSDRTRALREKANPEGVKFVEQVKSMGGSLPLKAVREAIGSGAWDSIMLDALYRRLTKGWVHVNESLPWRSFVSNIKSVRDFKTQYAIQTGDFTTLTAVPAGGPYFEAQFSDDRASYAITKYGNTFGVSFEAMTNDDLNALGGIAEKFGRAAARTVNSYVISTLINANPTLYDSIALFHSDHSNNLGASTPLNQANLETAKQYLRQQTDMDGNYLELRAKYLLVDPSNEWNARRLLESPEDSTTANRAINVHKGSLEVVVSNYVTDGVWYLVADPSILETIELGFYGGREAPEIFEEDPNSGHAFEFDERRWKCRSIFGGTVVDYRPFVRGNVA